MTGLLDHILSVPDRIHDTLFGTEEPEPKPAIRILLTAEHIRKVRQGSQLQFTAADQSILIEMQKES
jgi:hypothetical protein